MSTAITNQATQTDAQRAMIWKEALYLYCELKVELKVPRFKVRDLLRLEKGSVVDTRWKQSSNVPLQVNGQPLAWTEFEVLSETLAVRLMELM